MKKYIYVLILSFIILILGIGCTSTLTKEDLEKYPGTGLELLPRTGTAEYGQLKVIGSQLCDSEGNPVQLRGMSSAGLQWFGQFMNKESITWLKEDWKIKVIRAAMYTASDGYISYRSYAEKVLTIVDAAIDLGIYAIIDWHILQDGNPNKYKEEAIGFFRDMATIYNDTENVIYEICNEPNGQGVSWKETIKPYAKDVIEAIRLIDPDAIIIVGTATWSQDINLAATDPLSGSNIMYACHFYAHSHTGWLRDRISGCINGAFGKKIAIFVSEWGTTDYTGNTNFNPESSEEWINFLDKNKISWVNWSLCNKREGSAALKPNASFYGNWDPSDLTPSGTLVRSFIIRDR